jgi:hypothetical protein
VSRSNTTRKLIRQAAVVGFVACSEEDFLEVLRKLCNRLVWPQVLALACVTL